LIFLAPERFSEDEESKAVDLWSIGCIMYFLLFGEPPFYSNKEDEEECDDEIVESVLQRDVRFPAGKNISDLAKDLIMHLLDKDPIKRFTADQVLQHPWMSIYEPSSPLSSSPVTNSIYCGAPEISQAPVIPTIEMKDYLLHCSSSSGTQ
jgi:serine/threonine protein kinase